MLPEIVLGRSKRDLNKWPPLRPLGFADQAHVRFTRKPVAFARIARNTRANHVFPSRRTAPVAWHDVIQIKLAPIEAVGRSTGKCSCRARTRCGCVNFTSFFGSRSNTSSTITRGMRILNEIVVTTSWSGAFADRSRQLSKSCVEKLFASSEETIWACPAYTSEKARRAEQMFTACQSRLSTKT